VVLLPKKPGAKAAADYHPIPMIHNFVTMASKLMANRLGPRLHEIISPNQNAFIKRRTIHDNFKFVQQAGVYVRRKKIPKALLKLDISKAFDAVLWPFLLESLHALGFDEH
jgi:hypothetical protein